MSAVLTLPQPETLRILPQPEATLDHPPRAVANVSSLLGGGLVVCGLLRGSWAGLTLAAVGGYLIYRGRSPLIPDPPRIPDASSDPEEPSVLSLVREWPEEEDHSSNGPAIVSVQNEVLTPEEHTKVEIVAYFRALRRGGGFLPPGDHALAVEDFCWAAQTVLRQRVGC